MPRRSNKASNSIATVVILIIIIVIALVEFFDNSPVSPPPPTQPVPVNPEEVSPVPSTQVPANSALPGWLEVYFTNPNPPDNLGQGIDRFVQPVIDKSTSTIDVTSFDLNLPSLVNALSAAAKRGVKVRVVYDGENGSTDLKNAATNNKTLDAVKTLKAAGVKLVNGGRTNGLMHNKMIIVDGKTLFIGSWNMSYNDTYRNNNNLLKITDSNLIANYQAKFNELFVDKLFGPHAEVKVPYPSVMIGGVKVENYFSPEDGVMAKLINDVKGAKKSIHFIAFTYTDQELAAAMIARAKAKVDVQGVIENRGASQGALVPLYCAKLPVKVDGNKYTMHHKVIIIDGQTVITGSFNFTKAADDANDDNVLVIHSPVVAALYEQEYQRVTSIAENPDAAEINCN